MCRASTQRFSSPKLAHNVRLPLPLVILLVEPLELVCRALAFSIKLRLAIRSPHQHVELNTGGLQAQGTGAMLQATGCTIIINVETRPQVLFYTSVLSSADNTQATHTIILTRKGDRLVSLVTETGTKHKFRTVTSASATIISMKRSQAA